MDWAQKLKVTLENPGPDFASRMADIRCLEGRVFVSKQKFLPINGWIKEYALVFILASKIENLTLLSL